MGTLIVAVAQNSSKLQWQFVLCDMGSFWENLCPCNKLHKFKPVWMYITCCKERNFVAGTNIIFTKIFHVIVTQSEFWLHLVACRINWGNLAQFVFDVKHPGIFGASIRFSSLQIATWSTANLANHHSYSTGCIQCSSDICELRIRILYEHILHIHVY